MRKNSIVTAVVAELRLYGIEPCVEHRRKHLAIHWQVGGRQRVYFTSASPSDWRSSLNARAQVRRFLREDGVLK